MNAAPDITIRRCTLRIARRGGWSWGADAQSLMRRVLERLPALLERRFAALGDSLPEGCDVAEPLRLRIPLHRQQWRELSGGPGLTTQMRAQLEALIDAAASRALPSVTAARTQGRPAQYSTDPRGDDADGVALPTESPAPSRQPSALWKLLTQWRAAGRLPAQLAALDEAVLHSWLECVLDLEVRGGSDPPAETRVAELWREACALPILLPAGTARSLARRLAFVHALKSQHAMNGAQLRETLARHCVEEPSVGAGAAADDHPVALPKTGPQRSTRTPLELTTAMLEATASQRAEESFEVNIPCALPFLLLTPLSRAGYLATLAAALEAAKATALAPGFALGLAHKCLAAPQRGWLRDAGMLGAAAAFAGRCDGDNELIFNAGRALHSQLGLLDDGIAAQLLDGHRAEAAWLVALGGADAVQLFDEDGLAPVAAGSFLSLAARIAPTAAVVFLPAAVASTAYLDTLDELQIPYASDADLAARPACTRFIARDGRRLSVSRHGAQQGRARGIAERGAALIEAALANWRALHVERPAQRPGVDTGFEMTLSLAAGYALSAIAWSLWRPRQRATAKHAIDTFEDLSARVRVTPDRVHVILPMGRRAWDLRDRGLLGDVREVPWLNGRIVTFGVG